jgi:ribosomal protein S2
MKNKIVDLMLIKSHYCEKNLLIKNNLKYIKPALQMIHKCHINNKKILFIGMPAHYLSKIKNLQHVFITESAWVKGILTNNKQVSDYLKKKKLKIKNSKFLLNLTKKPDLIVILNKTKTPETLNEGYLARIPVITFDNELLPIKDFKSSYKIPQNILTESNQNLIIPFIISIIKKKINKIIKKKIMYKKRKLSFYKKKTKKK